MASMVDPDELQLALTERLSGAAEHKTDGNARFKKQDYSSALRQYKAALKGLAGRGDLEKEVEACLAAQDASRVEDLRVLLEEYRSLRCDCNLNAAACTLKTKDFTTAADHCRAVLKAQPSNKKALFRLGQAYHALGKLSQAEDALSKARAADPDDRQVLAKLKEVKALLRDDLKDDFGGLFKKAGYSKGASSAAKARRAREQEEFEALRKRYVRHLTAVLERCCRCTGDAFEDYGAELEQLADAGARKAAEKDKALHDSLREPRKKLWKLFYVAARKHDDFRITKGERESCDACHVEVPSVEMLKFEKKHGTPEYLKKEKDPMAREMEIHEEMRDAMEETDEKKQWDRMLKVREKMGKGPPVMLPYESKEKTDQIIASMSGEKYNPDTAIPAAEWDKYDK